LDIEIWSLFVSCILIIGYLDESKEVGVIEVLVMLK